MISPELLRRYPCFGNLDAEQLKKISMISETGVVKKGATIFQEGDPANTLYVLMEGAVDLYFHYRDEYNPQNSKDFSVGEINPGEMFAISALIEPHILEATARAAQDCKLIMIEAKKLREMCQQDEGMACACLKKIIQALLERLTYARVQLAAHQE
jgi:CRP-like cAMP-binding protein